VHRHRRVIQFFNVGAERMLGYRAADVVNTITPAELSDPPELVARATALSAELGTTIAPGFEALVFKASRGIEDIYELTYVRSDGTRFPAIVSVTALRDPRDDIIGYLLIGTDNTVRRQIDEERRRLEQQLQHKNDELEAASRMKSEFLANMSHELRTPLNAVIGFSEILRDGLMGDITEQQRACVEDIFTSGKHLLSLINDILDLSKIEAGKLELDLEPVRVSSLFLNSLSIVREKAASRNIRLGFEADEDLGTIQADARKVKQIVYNLLSNAVKFSIEGGEVSLRATRVPRASVGRLPGPWPGRTFPLPDSSFSEFLAISVTDSGIGLFPAELERLFMPFSQIDSGLARKFEGTGLGLVMIKQLAELHCGTVAVESAEGEGARFTVWLPLRDPVESIPAASPVRLSDREVPAVRTALVVEDDPRSAELIRLQLEAEGFNVLLAPSAEAGLVMAARRPLALITLDIMLPSMDGWEFLRRLKQVPALSRIPVVIISIVADRNKGFALGAAAVMQKPIARQELFESLVELGLFPFSQRRALRVLVVDDDPASLALTTARLEGLASTVLAAGGGLEAIGIARRERPDLILLDLMMPGVSGFDVVEALQEDGETACIPIVVLTASRVSAEDRARLNSHVKAIMEKADYDQARFSAEIRRAVWSRKRAV